jgi:phosphoribosylformylglycinamidine synthase
VYYVGAKTGRDGIHGATRASAEFDQATEEKRPNVQVGDPFMEKLLLEACLEVMKTDALVGIQDMGAAGLTCSTCEMGSRGGSGVEIDVVRVPQRETGMTPYEIMLSESQERMLFIVKRIAEIPNRALADEGPVYDRPTRRPSDLDERQRLDLATLPASPSPADVLTRLLASPQVASKRWIYRQYDHMVRTNTIAQAGMGAGVVRVKGTRRALAFSVDGNGRHCFLDPKVGAMLAVAESARNVACTGALPVGATNCLNFGNPERPEIMWQFARAVDGIAEACRGLEIPITGGNVSLYNETEGVAIHPTPVIGVVGVIDDASRVLGRVFRRADSAILLLGESAADLGGSEYLKVLHRLIRGTPPPIDIAAERALQRLLVAAITDGVLESAHDCAEGGMAVTLAESCFESGGIGADVSVPGVAEDAGGRADIVLAATLFGETASRVLVSLAESDADGMLTRAREAGVPARVIGRTGGPRLRIAVDTSAVLDCSLSELEHVWADGLIRYFEGRAA